MHSPARELDAGGYVVTTLGREPFDAYLAEEQRQRFVQHCKRLEKSLAIQRLVPFSPVQATPVRDQDIRDVLARLGAEGADAWPFTLSKDLASRILARLGLGRQQPRDLDEVASEFGVSLDLVRHLETHVLQHLLERIMEGRTAPTAVANAE
jgi:hypothetical protein